MSPEIRLSKLPKFAKRAAPDLLITFGVIIFLIFSFLKTPDSAPSTYQAEYTYLQSTQQLLLAEAPLESEVFEKVTVTAVTDGDTIKVRRADGTEVPVRYIGIDTPEIKHQGNGEEEAFGQQATEMNASLVEGKVVYLQRDAEETDRYGRLLRYVYLEDGAMVNYVIIRLGYATILTIPPNVAFQQKLFSGYELAKEEKRNLYK